MKSWKTIAPNGDKVTLNVGLRDVILKHGEIITNENLAKAYPNIFYLIEDNTMNEGKKQILTEVPKPVVVAPETDKPEADSSDDEADSSDDEAEVSLSAEELDEKFTKKELIVMASEKSIDTKGMNKSDIIEALI